MRDSWRLATGPSALALTAAACGTTVPLSELSTVQTGSSGLPDGAGTGLHSGLGSGNITRLQAFVLSFIRTCYRRS